MQIADDIDGVAGPARAADRGDRSASAQPVDGAAKGANPEESPSQSELLGSVWKHAAEFRAYAEELIRIEKDRAHLAVREAFARFRREALVFFALCTLVVIGSIYTLTGLSEAIAALFRDQAWVGNLSIGLAAIVGAVVWMRIRETGKDRGEMRKKVEEYAQRNREQSARFGRHVSERYAGVGEPPVAHGTHRRSAPQREGIPRSPGEARAPGDGGMPGGPTV